MQEHSFRLGITTREVADFSQRSRSRGQSGVSHLQRMADTSGKFRFSSSIFKLYSLSSIYRIKFTDLLLLYGLDLQHLSRNQMDSPYLIRI